MQDIAVQDAGTQGPGPRAGAVPYPTTPDDVVGAYRFLLGRDPEDPAVIERNLRRAPAEIIAVLARSPEFRKVLDRRNEGRPLPHAMLGEARLRATHDWLRGIGWPLPTTPLGPMATLLAALPDAGAPAPAPSDPPPRPVAAPAPLPDLSSRPVAAPAPLPDAPPYPAAVAPAPPEGRPHLTAPADPADQAILHHLLLGTGDAPAAAPPAGTLHDLLREALAVPAARTALQQLAEGGWPPRDPPTARDLQAWAAWIEDRVGGSSTGLRAQPHLGALLAALLGDPALRPLLADTLPAPSAVALADALPALATGAAPLHGTRATATDVGAAYLAVLGRESENAAVRRSREGLSLWALLLELAGSEEFRTHVLARTAGGGAPAHMSLPLEARRATDAWLSGRLGIAPAADAPLPLHPAALLLRLLSLPAIEAELARLHGLLWLDARAALGAALAAEAGGQVGAIDYVTGDWIVGWALDRAAPAEPLDIEILCDGVLVGFGRADRPRPDAAAEEGAGRAGFRIAWHGRDRSHPTGALRFRIQGTRTGLPIGPAFQLDSIFAEPRDTLQILAGELAEARRTLRRLEAMLPQLESFAAWPPAQHAQFRRAHRLLPPDSPPATWAPIHVVLDAEGVSVRGLRRVLAALQAQTHAGWTAACLVADPERRAVVDAAAVREPRLTAAPILPHETVPDAEHRAVAATEAPLVLLLPPGYVPHDTALAWFAHAAARLPDSPAAFADEDALVEEARFRDRHEDPVLRGALDPWVLPLGNPCGEVVCARRDPLLIALDTAAASGERARAAQRWIAWASLAGAGPVAHVPRLLTARLRDEVTEDAAEPSAPVPAATLRPLLRHPWLLPGTTAAPPAASPAGSPGRITAIMPTRNGHELLEGAIDSLRAKAADPARLELLVVDNGSDRPDTLTLLDVGQARGDLRVLRIDEPFNWSRLNNRAAQAATGDILLFINDDTRMLTAGWDDTLRRLLAVPEVGAVGARLVYEDLTLQHAGVVFGAEAFAAHEGVGAAMDAPGPGGRWQALRQVGGVTGAFLATRRDAFAAVGPFDEHGLGVTFNDVDFCLRLRAAGLAVLYAPDLVLVHFESKSRGFDDQDRAKRDRAEAEARWLLDRWGDGILIDPGYNPHWSRWNRPFTALREPSPAEIEAHLMTSGARDPWNPRGGADAGIG